MSSYETLLWMVKPAFWRDDYGWHLGFRFWLGAVSFSYRQRRPGLPTRFFSGVMLMFWPRHFRLSRYKEGDKIWRFERHIGRFSYLGRA